MNHYRDVDVLCPFYKRFRRDRQSITCEGVPKSSAGNMMLFENGNAAQRYFDNRCCGQYGECPIAQLLYEKYDA